MRLITTSAIFFLLFLNIVHSQQSADYVLAKTGEKIEGKIFQPINALKEVQLKKAGDSGYTTYSATDIQGYAFGDKFYSACEVKEGEGKLFLLTLVNGSATLYLLVIQNIYYVEKDGRFHAITKKDKVIGGKFMEDRRFEGTLRALFNDCKLPDESFKNVKFTESSLRAIVQEYNVCRDPSLTYKEAQKATNLIKFGAFAGIGSTKGELYNFISPDITYDGNKLGYVAGLELILSHPSLPSLVIRPGIGITRKKAGLIEQYSQDNTIITIDYTGLQLPVKFSYFFANKTVSPYLTAGAAFSLPLHNESVNRQIHTSSGNVVAEEKMKLKGIYEVGAIAAIGLQLQKTERMQPFVEYQLDKTWLAKSGRWSFLTHYVMLGVRF